MGFMTSIKSYKKLLMRLFWRNDSIKGIIKKAINIDDLSYSDFRNYVKPYPKHPDTIKDKGVYIFFEVDAEKQSNPGASPNINRYPLDIWIISSEDIETQEDGTVITDDLSAMIDYMLNQAKGFGIGTLEFFSSLSFSTPKGFVGRKLSYVGHDFGYLPHKVDGKTYVSPNVGDCVDFATDEQIDSILDEI